MRFEKEDEGRGEIERSSRGLKFGKFSIRSESFPIFEDPLEDPSYSSAVQGNRIFWTKREPTLLSGSIREFWKNDTPGQGELYLRIFMYLSSNFTSPILEESQANQRFRDIIDFFV